MPCFLLLRDNILTREMHILVNYCNPTITVTIKVFFGKRDQDRVLQCEGILIQTIQNQSQIKNNLRNVKQLKLIRMTE